MIENWKPVVGYEGLYEVSDHGRVRSMPREVRTTNQHGPVVRQYRGRELNLTRHTNGYLRAGLSKDGKVTVKYVHRLVLEAFEGPCPPGHECCHWDDDPTNNRIDNLRWDTPVENQQDMARNNGNYYSKRTHCVNGHELTEDNIYRKPSKPNKRECRTCTRERKAA